MTRPLYALTMRLLLFGLGLLGLAGCHSSYVEATVKNLSGSPVTLVEVDYPSASFGTQELAPGAQYHYRFKVLGSGPLKLLWTDIAHTEQHSDGPGLQEGDEGSLEVDITRQGAQWTDHRKGH